MFRWIKPNHPVSMYPLPMSRWYSTFVVATRHHGAVGDVGVIEWLAAQLLLGVLAGKIGVEQLNRLRCSFAWCCASASSYHDDHASCDARLVAGKSKHRLKSECWRMADMRIPQNRQRSEGKLARALFWLGLRLIIACLM
jgi:hypothetical protein